MDNLEVIFDSNYNICIQGTQFHEIFKPLDETTKENDLKLIIEHSIDIYKTSVVDGNSENSIARNLLVEFFTRFANKRNIKKYLQDKICKTDLVRCIVRYTAKEIEENIITHKLCYIKQCINFLNFLYILQISNVSFDDETTQVILPAFVPIIEAFVAHSRCNFEAIRPNPDKLFLLLNAICKQVLHAFNKNSRCLEIISRLYSGKLTFLSLKILENSNIGFDLKTKCGLILAHALNVLPVEKRDDFKFKDFPCLDLIYNSKEPTWFTLDNVQQKNLLESNLVKVVIYSAIFNVVPQDQLLNCHIFNETLLTFLYEGLIQCSKRTAGNAFSQIIEVSRTLNMLGKNLKFVPLEKIQPLFVEGLFFIWTHIEHFVDTVRTYAKLFLTDLTSLAAFHRNNGNDELIGILLENLRRTSKAHGVRFHAMENISSQFGCSFLISHFPNLQENLLQLTSDVSVGDQACKSYINLMQKHQKEVDAEKWCCIWVKPVAKVIKLKNTPETLQFQQKIICSAFQQNPAALRTIYPPNYTGNSQECYIILKGLQIVRKTSFKVPLEENNEEFWRGLILKRYLDLFKIHQDEEIRIAVLATVVECQKSTESFLEWELQFLLSFFKYNTTSPIPNIRKQVLSYYKKALSRFDASLFANERNVANLHKKNEITGVKVESKDLEKLIKCYKSFLISFCKLLIRNLARDANFFRRSCSLELLPIVQSCLTTEEWINCWSKDDVNNCHNILYDSYESNKKMAVEVLKNLPPELIGFKDEDFTKNYLQNCLEMAMDIKPSKTLSAAYMFEICAQSPYFCQKLENPLLHMLQMLTVKLKEQSTQQLDVTNAKTSHYGIILSIKHLLENRQLSHNNPDYSVIFLEIVTICLRIKLDIMPIVCSSSPEGYLPSEGEELNQETDESARSQMILVYAWRTMKEMTLLLAEIVRQTVKLEGSFQMLPEQLLLDIGQLFVEVFLESKHRGVFEQAYVGFSTICEVFWISVNANVNELPRKWLIDVLLLCIGEKQSNKLCTTRRSAGLPFLILSILTTEPSFDRINFKEAMKMLLGSCANLDATNNEHRMHSLNVLRALYRHSKLGEQVSPYIAQGVIVAITGFKSNTWSVRNSATLLYSALMTRMFGVQRTQDSEDVCLKNRLTVRVFFMRYPELFSFLLDTLSSECQKNDSLILHPVLMILARLYPSHIQEYNTQMEKYLPFVTICLSNPVYRTRELAARASVPLISSEDFVKFLDASFQKIPSIKRENQLNGLLLQILHVIKSNNSSIKAPRVSQYLWKSLHLLEKPAGTRFSHLNIALYFEIVTEFLTRFTQFHDLDVLKQLLLLLSRQSSQNFTPTTSQLKFPQNKFILVLFIILKKFEETSLTYSTVTAEIVSHLTGNEAEMRRFCMYFLIYLNHSCNGFKHVEHPLFATKELEIPSQITSLIETLPVDCRKKILRHSHPHVTQFLLNEITTSLKTCKNDQKVLLFLLLNYYPCVFEKFHGDFLEFLLSFCNCDNEELISAVIANIEKFLSVFEVKNSVFGGLVEVLSKSAAPAAADFRRLAVCELLTRNSSRFFSHDSPIKGEDLCNVLNMVLILLEDDDLLVRNAISNLKFEKSAISPTKKQINHFWPVVPEKTKEKILLYASETLPTSRAVCFIFSWACRHFPDFSNDVSEIFERGELNLFAENIPIAEISAELLRKLLKTSQNGYVEVTDFLRSSLEEFPSEMMDRKTKKAVVEALYLFNSMGGDFHRKFSDAFDLYLGERTVKSDHYTVKTLMYNIYDDFFQGIH